MGYGLRALGLAMLVLAAITSLALAAKDDNHVIGRASGAAGVKGDNGSEVPSVSADGRYVAFMSFSTNLHPNDTDDQYDVYVRDLLTQTTILVSRATGAGVPNDDFSYTATGASLSSDGRYVAFHSNATTLHPDDDDTPEDVYIRDIQANTTTLLSRAAGANGAKGDLASFAPSLSPDGRYLAFSSIATNLHPQDTDTTTDIFVRDLQTHTMTLASRATGAGGAKGTNHSTLPSVSGDGRYVAFQSQATNLHPNDPGSTMDIYVRDMQSNTTTLASRATGAAGAKANAAANSPALTPDGRYVAFHSTATNLAGDSDTPADVFVRDLQTDTTTLVSRATGLSGASANASSAEAAITPDGRFVAFESAATNLDPSDTDTDRDVYVRDLQTNTTTLVSRAPGPGGASADSTAQNAALPADGRYVAFDSSAGNLSPDDTDNGSDVFVRELLDAPPALPGGGGGGGGGGAGPSLPPPVLGQAFNVERVSGRVLIASGSGPQLSGRAGASQKGRRFVPLTEPRQLTVGSFLDTKNGRVRISTATDLAGGVQTGEFFKGVFQVLQSRSVEARGLTTMKLKGSSFRRCRGPRRAQRASVGQAIASGRRKLSARTVRRLGASANGRFRSRGRHSSATVRGTIWVTADRCDGTLTQVKRGRVAVRDFRRRRTIVLTAGKRYLATPR